MEPTGKTSEEVEVPKLAKNGQNWKIYRAKIIKAAATDITDPLGVLAGWQLDDGSYNWECLDVILKWTFYTSVPITILHPIRKLDTAHKIFNYLAKHFCDNNPIVDPCTKNVKQASIAAEDISADVEKPKESPTSKSTAAETLTSANRDEENLSTTKDLTRGTEDINSRNTRCQDPRTSLEALAKVTSAKCTETTAVVLESAPHKMQNQPQNSLPLTLRPPIEGGPSECKQEVVESIMMAERTNGMVKMAKPTEIADIDRMALLGGEPAERACGVNEGDGTEHEGKSRLQETNLLCEETRQHSGNATEDTPSARKLPLVGEWTVCASGKVSDLEVKPADSPIESKTLIVISIESEVLGGGDILRVRPGGMQMRTGNVNGSRGQTDWSEGQADVLRGWTDTPDASNNAETNVMDHGESASMYLRVRDAKRVVVETDGTGTHADVSTRQGEVPSVELDAIKPVNATEIVRMPQMKPKLPDSPMEAAWQRSHEPNSIGDHADRSSMPTEVHNIGYDTEMAASETVNIRK